ncbi:uncharacterized protein LOC127161099 isoform X3 [Labeo rohita]|uniref:uncharacterized protein LOC127161099 isoform X3 n=1 Tax=Labeo rohita TaxID=84645 RepID=UPI0021E1CAA9|nr:uncharacterized protein LOC127161099 isoform X3 [Labeo rohita]
MYRFTGVRVLSTVMMMKTLLLLTVCHMGDAADTVTGITGGSVIINCVYSHENVKTRENAKSFCKMLDSECTTVTEVKNDLWIPEERFSMIDDKSLGLVNVLIRNLTVNDSGTYRCKADSTWFQEVKFNVEQESCCVTSEEQTAYILGTAVIHCKYPEKYKDHPKHLYKVENGSLVSLIHIFGGSDTNERFSLNDNEQKHVLTATIANVSRRDDGVYFCGTGNTPHAFLFKEIQLHVSGDKGKARTDASVQSDLYIIILVVMCLILLLAGGLTLLLLNQRCKKTHGSGSSHQGNMREGDDEGVSSPHYEVVSDSGNTPLRPSAQKPISLNTVYDTARLPTNPSDSDFYTLAEQPQNMTSVWLRGVVRVLVENLLTEEVSFIMCLFEVELNLYVIMYLWILIIFIIVHYIAAYLQSVFTLVTVFLLSFQSTHTVCYYEPLVCTDSYGLGPYDPHLTYSIVIFQTTDHC